MNNLGMLEAKLPPGFRFHPRDEELIYDYLMKKIAGTTITGYYPVLIEVDLNNCEPWDIPETACVGGKDWYFYSHRDRKYATGLRTNRATVSGYWKATGKDRAIHRKGRLLGMRKTLVFYQGRAPKGKKSDWVMHEFRLHGPSNIPSSSKEDWVLCKVFNKTKDQLESESESAAKSPQGGILGQGNSNSNSSCCFDDTTFISCSSDDHLPPLMEYSNSYINNFHNQSQPPSAPPIGNNDFHQQVSCFSNSDHDHHDHDDNSTYTTMMMMRRRRMKMSTSTSIFSLPPALITSSSSCGAAGHDNILLPQLINHNYNINVKESPSLDQTLFLSDHDHDHVNLPPIWDYY